MIVQRRKFPFVIKTLGVFALTATLIFGFENCGQLTAKQLTSSSSELSPLRDAESQIQAASASSSTLASVAASPAFVGTNICAIRGGAGLYLSRIDYSTQADCQAKCASFAASNPNRTCTWNNAKFFGDPVQACQISGGAHVSITSTAQTTFIQCQSSCASAAAQHPYRICEWGTDRFYQPGADSECRVIGGAGKMLLNPSVFGSLSDCQATCASFQSNIYRQCYYGSTSIFAPSVSQRCDIWGGAGKVLIPSFYGSQSDCTTSCASFVSNPNRICLYGKVRVQ